MCPGLMFVGTARSLTYRVLEGVSLGEALAILANNRQNFPGTNTLAYYGTTMVSFLLTLFITLVAGPSPWPGTLPEPTCAP
jgi:hypothetical protein